MEEYVAETIRSVLAQTYRDWEMIIIDDGSTDSSLKTSKVAAGGDPRIRILRNDVNKGVSVTANLGLHQATGFYMARLDADDVAQPEWLQTRVAFLESHPSVVVVSSSRFLINEAGHRIGRTHESQLSEIITWELIFGNPIPQSGTVCVLDAVRKAGGYNQGIRTGIEDWELWVKLSMMGTLIIEEPPMINYRVNSRGLSAVNRDNRASKEQSLQLVMPSMGFNATGRKLPGELLWLLYRNRPVTRERRDLCQQANRCVLELYEKYLEQHAKSGVVALLAASVLDKIAHISACDKWNLLVRGKILGSVLRRVGWRAITCQSGWRAILKLLVPLTRAPSIS